MAEQKRIKQLTQAEKRSAIAEQLRIAGQLSNRNLAKILGVSATTVGNVRRELADKNEQIGQMHTQDDWCRHPYFLANKEQLLAAGLSEKSWIALRNMSVLDKMAEIGSLSPRYCQRLLYKERKAANKSHCVTVSEQDVRIFVGDVRTGLVNEIPDGSVQLCFVDMPYDRKSIEELTPHIAMTASRILSEGASLLLMVGGSHLDIVFNKLSTADKGNLRFQWDILYVCPRGTPYIQGRSVTTAVKHIIWMVKGKYTGPIQYDYLLAPPDPETTDKAHHIWGVSVDTMRDIIERFTEPGQTVCDFMFGGGSSAVASALTGRCFVGCDIDSQAFKTTKKRVAELFGAD